jgi:hypothetical protein
MPDSTVNNNKHAVVIYHNMVVGAKYAMLLMTKGFNVSKYYFLPEDKKLQITIDDETTEKNFSDQGSMVAAMSSIRQQIGISCVAIIEANVNDFGGSDPNWPVLELSKNMLDNSKLAIFSNTAECIVKVAQQAKDRLSDIESIAYLVNANVNKVTAEMLAGSPMVPINSNNFATKLLEEELKEPDWDALRTNVAAISASSSGESKSKSKIVQLWNSCGNIISRLTYNIFTKFTKKKEECSSSAYRHEGRISSNDPASPKDNQSSPKMMYPVAVHTRKQAWDTDSNPESNSDLQSGSNSISSESSNINRKPK